MSSSFSLCLEKGSNVSLALLPFAFTSLYKAGVYLIKKQKETLMHVRSRLLFYVALLGLVFAVLAGFLAAPRLSSHAADANPNCSLIVPSDPLSAAGLATPYQLVATDPAAGPCNEANANQSAFVQGAIIAPNGQISLYNPLVVDTGTQPAVTPTMPTLPDGAIVALWFGFNGTTLKLTGAARQGHCINGLGNDLFGQFAYCNASAFFARARQALRDGRIVAPPLGTALDGKPCPTVRDFSIVDQDQSDNVTTSYLVSAQGGIAQNTDANAAALGPGAITNGSDNRLLAVAVDSALGCTPWKAPDLANNGALATSLPLNELSAMVHQPGPPALVPLGDPMTLKGGKQSITKTNLYRYGVDQPPLFSWWDNGNTKRYCQRLATIAIPRINLDKSLTIMRPSPTLTVANSLYTFLAQRLQFTFSTDGLNCVGLLHIVNPVTATADANGIVTSAVVAPVNLHKNEKNNYGGDSKKEDH
jgi:hypothetical protein